jgi:hypothetical protein
MLTETSSEFFSLVIGRTFSSADLSLAAENMRKNNLPQAGSGMILQNHRIFISHSRENEMSKNHFMVLVL